MKKWQIDVATFGPSIHDKDSYDLIRAYKSLENREQSQEAFYNNPDWRQGPREAIIALIENGTTVVLDATTLKGPM